MKNIRHMMVRGRKWDVEFVDGLIDEDNGNMLDGLCDYDNFKIYVRDELNDSHKLETLLHEYMHAVMFEAGSEDQTIANWVDHFYINNISKDMAINHKFWKKLF